MSDSDDGGQASSANKSAVFEFLMATREAACPAKVDKILAQAAADGLNNADLIVLAAYAIGQSLASIDNQKARAAAMGGFLALVQTNTAMLRVHAWLSGASETPTAH